MVHEFLLDAEARENNWSMADVVKYHGGFDKSNIDISTLVVPRSSTPRTQTWLPTEELRQLHQLYSRSSSLDHSCAARQVEQGVSMDEREQGRKCRT